MTASRSSRSYVERADVIFARARPQGSILSATNRLRAQLSPSGGKATDVAMVDLGTLLTYRGRLHVVVGVTPMGATPRLLELEDVESGRIRRVEWTDPGFDTSPRRASDREDPTEEQASDYGGVHTGFRGCTYRPPDGEAVFTSYVERANVISRAPTAKRPRAAVTPMVS